ncbi:hypothetical protein EW145_g1850 [Phellinidium pouzarii]|uniref:Uncharacterized protein n=1 Tax=Phellinidium pouzarii TaxID=167371 RepID=A0A4S4LDG6_9AGAM|nr:hypothetical protein EW145_g1850 [Phellinidium pouzarii]
MASIKLNSGAEIPAIGLGTWQSQPEEVIEAVRYALAEAGYRHIDCAWGYQNEKEVGEGIRKSGVPRSEIFITSKLWSTYHSRVEEALDKTLSDLGVDYLDLYLIHWPVALNPNGNHPSFPTLPDGSRDIVKTWPLSITWKQMEEMVKKGKVKSIGVSNFSEEKLEQILPTATIAPAVDQLELHLYNPQHKLLAYLKSKGIVPQAYSPLGSTGTPLFSDELVVELAAKYNAEPAHILLAYLVKKDIVILPKSVTPTRIASNLFGTLAVLPKLDAADIEKLDGVAPGGKQKRFIMPPWAIDGALPSMRYEQLVPRPQSGSSKRVSNSQRDDDLRQKTQPAGKSSPDWVEWEKNINWPLPPNHTKHMTRKPTANTAPQAELERNSNWPHPPPASERPRERSVSQHSTRVSLKMPVEHVEQGMDNTWQQSIRSAPKKQVKPVIPSQPSQPRAKSPLVNPLLAKGSPSLVRFDLRLPYTSSKKCARGVLWTHLSHDDLRQPACHPLRTRMRIYTHACPNWVVEARAPSRTRSYVTVEDVLSAVDDAFNLAIDHQRWARDSVNPEHQERVNKAFSRRLARLDSMELASPESARAFGILRVDYLGSQYYFHGLSVTYSGDNSEWWMMEIVSGRKR